MYKVYLRGLIEISNRCRKNCLYCGIRAGNCNVCRYELSHTQVLEAARFALENGYGSVVLQAGERCDSDYVERVARMVYDITHLGDSKYPPLAVTLSLGEQTKEVYKYWMEAGAVRYLLRIEASDRELYEKIHPRDELHSYDKRVEALQNLKSLGYITGSGMMIGLPFQARENLENDLNFIDRMGIDMVGMGPYIPHKDTPLGEYCQRRVLFDNHIPEAMESRWESEVLEPEIWGDYFHFNGQQKVDLTIELIRELRRRLPTINIAATTALQVLSPTGREEAIRAGANVVMPNITLPQAKANYNLYEGKTGVDDSPLNVKHELERHLASFGCSIAWGEAGNPPIR